jgi:hypothetical protein
MAAAARALEAAREAERERELGELRLTLGALRAHQAEQV